MIWVLDYLADLESDLSRFHRIDDLYALDGPRFFRLVWRLSTYGGVMAMRLQVQREAQSPTSSPAPSRTSRPVSRGQRSERPLSAFMAQFPALIEKKAA